LSRSKGLVRSLLMPTSLFGLTRTNDCAQNSVPSVAIRAIFITSLICVTVQHSKTENRGILPEMSNCYCHPGKAGGSPFWNRRTQTLSAIPHILILANTGGSNGAQRGAWKLELQRQLCDRLGLSITVAHYPSGASKWNPIEHRMFSQISRNRRAEPLDSYEKTLKFIRTTTTKTGLKVTTRLDTAYYPTGTKVSESDLAQLSIRQKRVLPKWNSTISPQM
jgi:hypothetical protein